MPGRIQPLLVVLKSAEQAGFTLRRVREKATTVR